MSANELILFILLALAAEILGTVGGFGSSLFFVPVAGFFLDFYTVLGVTALFHVSSNISKIVLFRKGISKRLVLRMGIPAVVFVILGAFCSRYIDPVVLGLVLAVFLVLVSLFFMFYRKAMIRPGTSATVLGGVLSGFSAGIIGTGGAIRGVVLAAFNLEKTVFVATSAIIDLGVDAGRSVIYVYNGYVHRNDLYLVAILFIVSIAGSWLGKMILNKIPAEKFRTIVLIMILVTGIVSLISGVRDMQN